MATRHHLDVTPPEDVSLVILHPNFTNQHLLLSSILNRQNQHGLYFSFQSAPSDLGAAWDLLSTALSEQESRTLPALDGKATPEKAAQLALKAMKAFAPYTLVIEAFDLADASVETWIAAMVPDLPDGSQIILGGRALPLKIIQDGALRGKAQLFPVDPERMLISYMTQPADRVLLEVYGLGTGQALINGQRIHRWDGMLPRSLFFFFIDKGMVTRDEIFHTFWPNLSIREATNVFHVTKRKISEILGFDLTVYWSGFYRISPDIDLYYDVVKFGEHVQDSVVAEDAKATELLQNAIDLYQGTFLNTLEMDWANSRRSELNQTYTEALSSLAKLELQQGKPQEALGLYFRAAANQPQREDLARGIMSLLTDLGQPDRALEVYARLADELKHSLGVSPDRRTMELAEQIRSHA